MGADLIINTIWYTKGQKLDWDAGYKRIKEVEERDDLPFDEAYLQKCLTEVKGINDRRDATRLEFPPYIVYVTGGMSYGDSPTDLIDYINDLEEAGVLEAVGLNTSLIDYKKIIEKILTQKTLIPALMGLDPDLDAMIETIVKDTAHDKPGTKSKRIL